MIALQNYQQYNVCKEMFFIFAKQFAQGKMVDFDFFTYHKELMRADPQATHYAYQFASSSCYKKIFDAKELTIAFENKFKIKDVYNMNGQECDISTLNTAIIVDHMIRKTPFNDIPMTIFNAPLEYGTLHYKQVQASASVKDIVDKSKHQTGQTNNDLQIGDRLYDIKHTEKTSSVYNHIYPWTFERIQTHSQRYLNQLCVSLKERKNEFSATLKDEIMEIKDNPSLSQVDKIQIVNELLASKWVFLEKHDILIPIIIPMTTKPFKATMPKSIQEKLHLTANVTENESAARRAAYDCIILRYKGKATQVLNTANEMTNGLICSTPTDQSLDMVD